MSPVFTLVIQTRLHVFKVKLLAFRCSIPVISYCSYFSPTSYGLLARST